MKKWILPSNPKQYDATGAFSKLPELSWTQGKMNVEVGDLVYIYVSAPISAIKYCCEVTAVNLKKDSDLLISCDEEYLGKGEYLERGTDLAMNLKKTREYDDQVLSLAVLRKHGLKGNIQGAQSIPKRVAAFIDRLDVSYRTYIVFQGSHHNKEYEDGFLFAPLKDGGDNAPHHWSRLANLNPGDKVFHYCRGYIRAISTVSAPAVKTFRPGYAEAGKGRLVRCKPFVLEPPIDISDYIEDIIKYKKDKYSAFNNEGRANRGYIFELEPEIAILLEMAAEVREQKLIDLNNEEDDALVSELGESDMAGADEDFEYKGGKKKRPAPVYKNGCKVYQRDRKTAQNALNHANFKCEANNNHPTFIRKNSDKPYTEPHHLVPMSFSDDFDVSLDREENIVSLCSNCHNEIHYGRDAAEIIKKLYTKRKILLNSVGIDITLDELLKMYGIK